MNNRNSSCILALLLLCFVGAAAAHAERYRYDDAGRLTWVVYDDLSSIHYTYDPNGNILEIATTTAGIAGDADGDGDVDDADVAAILATVLAGGEPYSPTADCNGDSKVSVVDIVCAINAKTGGP